MKNVITMSISDYDSWDTPKDKKKKPSKDDSNYKTIASKRSHLGTNFIISHGNLWSAQKSFHTKDQMYTDFTNVYLKGQLSMESAKKCNGQLAA